MDISQGQLYALAVGQMQRAEDRKVTSNYSFLAHLAVPLANLLSGAELDPPWTQSSWNPLEALHFATLPINDFAKEYLNRTITTKPTDQEGL